jgi:UDP-glucose 4-epimerase
MILITGGLGFIGTNTARALLDLGESCVLTQHSVTRIPSFLQEEVGTRLFVEPLDITDQAAFLALGALYPITGIVHLASPGIWATNPIEDARANIHTLLNALQAARDWQVARISIASTIGVYGGVEQVPYREDMPLTMAYTHEIPTFKKSGELLANLVGAKAGIDVVNLRLAAIWGPLGRAESRFFAAPRLIHAAVNGELADFSPPSAPAYAEDGGDMCYVRDCGRAIALLQVAQKLSHGTYNVGSGRVTKNREVAAAIRSVIPEASIAFTAGENPQASAQGAYLDITRLREDTGFAPAYDVERAVADYIGWLRAGNER